MFFFIVDFGGFWRTMGLAAFLGKVDGYQATPELSRVSGVFRDGFRTFPIIFEYSGTPNIVRLDQIGLDITTDSLYAMVLEILEIPRNPTIEKKHAYIFNQTFTKSHFWKPRGNFRCV